MKTINLYFDFEFTSLSPDAQPISLGIVSGEANEKNLPIGVVTEYQLEFIDYIRSKGAKVRNVNLPYVGQYKRLTKITDLCSWMFSDIVVLSLPKEFKKFPKELEAAQKIQVVKKLPGKSFYAEFTDFDINRCDDWVKENVLSKTDIGYNKKHQKEYEPVHHYLTKDDFSRCVGDTAKVIKSLKEWLSQFSDYQIQFICDCGTWDWYWLVQLLAEWNNIKNKTRDLDEYIDKPIFYSGLPKLPDNISPVPFDLNDLIAIKKDITPKEAFYLNREELAYGRLQTANNLVVSRKTNQMKGVPNHLTENKHNALFDAKVIKEIYQKLNK